MQQARNCLCFIVSKMPDYKSNSNRMVKARIIKAVTVKARPVGAAQKAYALEAGKQRQLKVRSQEGWIISAGAEDFVIVGDAVGAGWVPLQHVVPVVRLEKVRHCAPQSCCKEFLFLLRQKLF